MQFQKESIIKH